MLCERCRKAGAEIIGETTLCESCLRVIIREWWIRFKEFGELSGAEQ